MKPRLPAAAWTQEDRDILWTWDETVPGISEIYQDQDVRDAELMLAWTQGWPIDLGGCDEEGQCLFWSPRLNAFNHPSSVGA